VSGGGLAALLLLGILAADGPKVRAAEPKKEARTVARYMPPANRGLPSILLRRAAGKTDWQRLGPAQRDISTGDTLVSLPGYRSAVHFKSGIDLTLWGDLPELSVFSPLLESLVVVHDPGDFDLDLTLDHGRIVLANPKARQPAKVRVHFRDPAAKGGYRAWEITFPEKDAEVALELWGRYPAGVPFSKAKDREGPVHVLYLTVLKGQANVRADDTTHAMKAPPGPALIFWDSRDDEATGPQRLQKRPDWATQLYPPFPTGLSKGVEKQLQAQRDHMIEALGELSTQVKTYHVDAALADALPTREESMRVLGLRCMGAIGNLTRLVDALLDKKHREVRVVAIEELRHYIGLNRDNGLQLYQTLLKKKYTPKQANVVMGLLHTLSDRDRDRPETYSRLIDYLRQDTPAIRELAHWHLIRLVPEGKKIPFDALGNADSLDRAFQAWKKLIPEGNLPKQPRQKH
jgi:hypothetical protein